MPHQAHLSQAGGFFAYARRARSALAWLVGLTLYGWAALVGAQAAGGSGLGDTALEQAPLDRCQPQLTQVWAARLPAGSQPDQAPPADGWVPVTLPHVWSDLWPDFQGLAWYRIDWTMPCERLAQPLGVAFTSINLAGSVRLNDTLLWRDQRLVEPLSRSWNIPRAWLLPAGLLQPGTNTFWVQVAGEAIQGAGLGSVRLGEARQVLAYADEQRWYRRTLPSANVVISGTLGIFFLTLWLLRRQERAYGWYALSTLAWVLSNVNVLLTQTPWPFPDTLAWVRWTVVWFVVYACAFAMYLWHFCEWVRPTRVRWLWGAGAMGVLAVLTIQRPLIGHVTVLVFLAAALLVLAVCVQVVVQALRTRTPTQLMLALCCLGFLAPAVHDALLLLGHLGERTPWTPITALIITVGMALVLAMHFTRTLRQVERFNEVLETEVKLAREDLAQTLRREHALELDNVRLNERLQLANELHDGLGSSLVRSLALVERSGEQLQQPHYLSMLKSLRDDLRQVVDTHGSAAGVLPETPTQWLAPLRHRFGRLLEEMGVTCHWQVPATWPMTLSTQQVLGLTRLLEEALTNVVKHSRARTLWVSLQALPALQGTGLQLMVQDDGVGFDAQLAQQGMGGLGLKSMQARVTRLGGEMQLDAALGLGTDEAAPTLRGTRLRFTLSARD